MIIRPDKAKIEYLFEARNAEEKKLSNKLVFIIPIFMCLIPMFVMVITNLMDSGNIMSFNEMLEALPICVIIGVAFGFVGKVFIGKLLCKHSVMLISQIKNTGIKVEDDRITGKMLKHEQLQGATAVSNTQQILPNRSFEVALKISNITNIEVEDKVVGTVNYGKFLTITLTSDKYYLMCLNDEDAVSFRSYVLNYKDNK